MDSIYHLRLHLRVIDDEIYPLIMRRQEIADKLAIATERQAMCRKADDVVAIINTISDNIEDPIDSLHYANTWLQPWRNGLPRKHFENVHKIWPEILPSNWTSAEASKFFTSLTKAFELDFAALENLNNE